MDITSLTAFVQEFMYALLVAGFFLWFVIYRGRQSTINLIFGLYLGLLFTQNLPFRTDVSTDPVVSALITIGIFIGITVAATIVIGNLMPEPYREKKLESFGKKLFLAVAATVLVLLFSFQVLPIAELVPVTSPFSSLFNTPEYFFLWLLAPFALLYFHK